MIFYFIFFDIIDGPFEAIDPHLCHGRLVMMGWPMLHLAISHGGFSMANCLLNNQMVLVN